MKSKILRWFAQRKGSGLVTTGLTASNAQESASASTPKYERNCARTDLGEILIPYLSVSPLRVVELYEGGFGQVLIAQDYKGWRVALKRLKADPKTEPSALIAEAKKLASLPPHPNVIEIIGFDWVDGKPCIALPAMNGSLRGLLGKSQFTQDAVVDVIGQVAFGLAHIHGCGVLHLDLKPENILVAEYSRYVISDFGLSAFLPSPPDPNSLSEYAATTVGGTLAYMSPEHFVTKRLTSKTDIFSLGVIMFELLTGRHPFASSTTSPVEAIVWQIMQGRPSFTIVEDATISSSLRALCIACLENNPVNRPSTGDIISALGVRQFTPPDNTSGDVNRANSLFELGHTKEAEQLINDRLANNPSDLHAAISAAEFAYKKGNFRVAAEIAERAARFALSKSPPAEEAKTLLVNLSTYYSLIDPEQSIRYARLAVKLDPNDWQAIGNVAEACCHLAVENTDAQKRFDLLEQGLAAIKEARRIAPTDLNTLIIYGKLLVAQKDLAALRAFLCETRFPPSAFPRGRGVDPNLGYLLISIYIALGEFEKAEELLVPMRKHPQFSRLVVIAEANIAERKRELGI